MQEKHVAIMNFQEDWKNILISELTLLGYTIEPTSDFREVSKKYFNFKKRTIPQNVRKVLKSKEFICPPEHDEGLKLLINKIEKGDIYYHI